MKVYKAYVLTGRVFTRDGFTYTVTSASTHGEVCVWDPSTNRLFRFDSREMFEHWAYGTPVSAAKPVSESSR